MHGKAKSEQAKPAKYLMPCFVALRVTFVKNRLALTLQTGTILIANKGIALKWDRNTKRKEFEMKLLTSGDVCEIVGLRANMLDDWCRKGLIVPVEGGEGTGDYRRFTLMQAVGIALAVDLRKSARGCALSYAGVVVEAIGAMSEEDLLEQFDRGLTRLMLVMNGVVVLDGPRPDDCGNLLAIYTAVKEEVANIENRLQHQRGGRTRGLAGAATN